MCQCLFLQVASQLEILNDIYSCGSDWPVVCTRNVAKIEIRLKRVYAELCWPNFQLASFAWAKNNYCAVPGVQILLVLQAACSRSSKPTATTMFHKF